MENIRKTTETENYKTQQSTKLHRSMRNHYRISLRNRSQMEKLFDFTFKFNGIKLNPLEKNNDETTDIS